MKSLLQLLKEANDILRSVNSIIERRGEKTNWKKIDKKVKMALAEQHELLLAKYCYISDVLALDIPAVMHWVAVSERLPEFGETVLVYCRIYGRFLATYEFIGEFQGEKYGNWRDFNGNLGILPPVYWLQIPEPPCA